MIPVRALRLDRYDAVTLDRQAFLNGEIFYDGSNNTLRLFDGKTTGGKSLATQIWTTTNFASLTAVTTNNATLNSAIALKAPIASPTFTGTVSGTFSGPLTGNVTGNVSGTSGSTTGNAATATKLAATKNINGVAFDGSASISVSSLVSGTESISIDGTSGELILNNGNAKLYADPVDSAVYLSDFGHNVAPNAHIKVGGAGSIFEISFGPGATKIWTFDYNGTLTAAGNITTTTTVASGSVTTTNDVTVGGNANISTVPTLPQHATNKKYVDARALAMSIAMS